jgi:hypothetical protein
VSVRSRPVNARTAVALLAAAALAAFAPAALAQDSPFSPVPPAQTQQTVPVQTQSSSTSDDEGLSRTQEILIGIAGFVLLFGIGYAIVRDARQAAPAGAHDPLETGERVKGTRPPKQKRVAQGRAKAKAAKRARRHNRP